MKNILTKLIRDFIESYKIATQASKDAKTLHSMTDRELNDIGINRADINRVCYYSALESRTEYKVEVNPNLRGVV